MVKLYFTPHNQLYLVAPRKVYKWVDLPYEAAKGVWLLSSFGRAEIMVNNFFTFVGEL